MVDISQQPEGRRELGKVSTYLLAACVAATLALSLMGPYLIRFLAPSEYWGADRLIPVVGAAYVFYSWTVIMDASFYITKKTFYKPIILAISCVAMAALYWYLIPRYGLMGAAWATLGGFASYAAFTALFAQRIYRIEYQFRRIASLLLLGCGLCVFGRFVSGTIPVIGLLARCGLLIAFPTILWVSGFLTGGEKEAILKHWQVLRLRFHNSTETT